MDPNIQLSQLDLATYNNLIRSLDQNGAWKTVLEFLTSNFQLFDDDAISALSTNASPSEKLLAELETRRVTIGSLATVLRECHLYGSLAFISLPEPMAILTEPNDLTVEIGGPFQLEYRVSGIPPPLFTWFKDDLILPDCNSSVLRYEKFGIGMEGVYICCATQKETRIYSKRARVEAVPVQCTVVQKPDDAVAVTEGSTILLRVRALGYPPPQFQWVHKNSLLPDEIRSFLYIPKATASHSGEYHCFILNKANEVVVKTNVIVHREESIPLFSEPVSEKIAFLIANDDYNVDSLKSPANDVITIAEILQQLNFKIVCFHNLNYEDFQQAIRVLSFLTTEGSIVFFYYAGHGFEHGDKYLLPTSDARNFKRSNSIPESLILQQALIKQPILFLLLLDMCLTMPNKNDHPEFYEEPIESHEYPSNRNLIKGYSTTTHHAAYENKSATNGVYVSILKNHLKDQIPILKILEKVNAGIENIEQMPNISNNTARHFCLNSPLRCFKRNSLYESLTIETKTTIIDETEITLRKCRNWFNNELELIIDGIDELEFESVADVTRFDCDKKVVLTVRNLQRLGDENLKLTLTFNGGKKFEVDEQFQISSIFQDI